MKIKSILDKNKSFVIDVSIYHQDILFIYGDIDVAVKEVNKTLQKRHRKKFKTVIDEIKAIEYRGVYSSRHPFRIIHIPREEKLSGFMSVLTHEALHCTLELLDYRGMKLGSKSEETYTHLLDHLIELIINEMFEK